MTDEESEQYKALLVWIKALDTATEAALAKIDATLASNQVATREARKADAAARVA